MKKILLFLMLVLMLNEVSGQSVLKTQDASDASKIIIPLKDNYFIYNNKSVYLNEYNSKHQFVKSIFLKKKYQNLNVFMKNDSLAILEGQEDQCDLFPKNAFSIDKNGKIKNFSSSNYLGSDYEQNIYFKLKNSYGIEIRKWRDSSIVAKIDLNGTSIGNTIFIPLQKDTFLLGDGQGSFYKSIASSQNFVKIPNFLVKTPINARSIINISPSHFFIDGQGVYSRKSLKLVLPLTDNSINVKEINGKIYIFKNSVQEYAPDSLGNFVKTNKILTEYAEKDMILNDFTPFKNKWLVGGGSPFYDTGQPSNTKYYQDFHGVVDSMTQEINNFNDISFNIPTQKEPIWDKKCGYKFENINFLIENKGKDTLKSLLLRGDAYNFNPFWCFGADQDFWRLDNLSIPPNTKFTYQLAIFCTRGIRYNNTSKDSIRILCITASSPNHNIDILYNDNSSCFTFSKDPKENFVKSDDISNLNVKIYNDEHTLYLDGNINLQNAKLFLYSIDGRLMFSEKISDLLPQQIDISNLPKAIYIVQIIIDNQQLVVKKIVK